MLPSKDPAESIVVEFDFAGEIASIDSAAIYVTVLAGADANPSALLQGASTISGTSVFQRIQGGIESTDYQLRAVATQGQDIRVRKDILPVR